MTKIYYNPNEDELIPIAESAPVYLDCERRHFHLDNGSWLACFVKCALMLVCSAVFLALEAQIIYEWWMHIGLWGIWLVLMLVITVIYGALMLALADADRIIF